MPLTRTGTEPLTRSEAEPSPCSGAEPSTRSGEGPSAGTLPVEALVDPVSGIVRGVAPVEHPTGAPPRYTA
ncbi:hypothetical protein ACWEK7_32865, partial [Streptomyces californicus]